MEETIYRTMLLIFILLFFLIRAPNVLKYRKTKKTKSEKPGSDRFLVALNFVTMMGMPLSLVRCTSTLLAVRCMLGMALHGRACHLT